MLATAPPSLALRLEWFYRGQRLQERERCGKELRTWNPDRMESPTLGDSALRRPSDLACLSQRHYGIPYALTPLRATVGVLRSLKA